MSAATTAAPGRAGSLNWMLPYTVMTAVGFGLLAAGDCCLCRAARRDPARSRGVGPFLAGRGPVGTLAVTYILSVNLPRRLDPPAQLWSNGANYAAFFLAAVLLAVLLRRWLIVISPRNAEAMRQAAELSHEAHWRALTVDVFGPVLELLDDLAMVGEPCQPRCARAGRLIRLIEAVNPRPPRPPQRARAPMSEGGRSWLA